MSTSPSIIALTSKVSSDEHHLPGLDLRQIQDAVDQVEQMLAGRLDPLQVRNRALIALVFGGFLLQQLAVENDGVQRRAQLVAHAGQELALGTRRRLGPLLSDAQLADERGQLFGVLPLACRGVLEHVCVVASSRSVRLRSVMSRT